VQGGGKTRRTRPKAPRNNRYCFSFADSADFWLRSLRPSKYCAEARGGGGRQLDGSSVRVTSDHFAQAVLCQDSPCQSWRPRT
jgi:hypothetical protein